ncbi:MAG TPA: FAD-dependent thymidylate synthase [Acetobacteraceae bacterium]
MSTTPRVYLLSRPVFTEASRAFLRDLLPPEEAHWAQTEGVTDAERVVEFAGRVCYMSFGRLQSGRTNAAYIHNLIRNGHDSVLEHAVWTFALTGISRAFTHQLVRHRVGFSYSQLSQQYHDETDARFVRPTGLDDSPEAAAIWDGAIRETQNAYKKLLARLNAMAAAPVGKEARRTLRSIARSILPNATETTIVVTANARAIRHFLEVRGRVLGDSEMRIVSATLLETLRPEAPALFADFIIEHPEDQLPLVRHVALP